MASTVEVNSPFFAFRLLPTPELFRHQRRGKNNRLRPAAISSAVDMPQLLERTRFMGVYKSGKNVYLPNMKKNLISRWLLVSCLLVSPSLHALTAKNPGGAPNNSEIGVGLKEALYLGAKNAVQLASRVDGFYKNPLIFIPFPPEAKMMQQTLETLGLKNQLEQFVKTLNRAAEEACKKAALIFFEAIKGLTISDGYKILKGSDYAATNYLRQKTSRKLAAAFQPEVRAAIEKVGVTKYWSPLAKRYNQIPFVKKANPNLDEYVTERAVSGLFKLIANEEKKIRKDPAARVTDILRRVFGT